MRYTKKNAREFPRVLIVAPTSDRHDYVIDRWMKAVDNIDYHPDRYAVLLVDTSINKGKYGKKLRKWGAKVIDLDWKPEKEHPIQMLARAREAYRLEAWKSKFDYILHLDTDVLIPRFGLKRLLSYDKDQVGFVVHAFFTKKGFDKVYGKAAKKLDLSYNKFKSSPAVFKSGFIQMGGPRPGLPFYTWKELKQMKGLTKVYAASIACLLVKKKVYSSVPFRTHESFVFGEDLWYYAEADEKGFESWIDPTVRCTHLNADWSLLVAKSKPKLNFTVASAGSNHPRWKKVEKLAKQGKIHVAGVEIERRKR